MGIVSRSQGASGSAAVLFDSTLLADTASIDTGANGIAQTSNVIEIHAYVRSDEVANFGGIVVTLNNDATAIYDRIFIQGSNATASANNAPAAAGWTVSCAGASQAAGVFSSHCLLIPNYTGTVANKSGTLTCAIAGQAAAATAVLLYGVEYRVTVPITRAKVAVAPPGTVLKTGSRVTILGR